LQVDRRIAERMLATLEGERAPLAAQLRELDGQIAAIRTQLNESRDESRGRKKGNNEERIISLLRSHPEGCTLREISDATHIGRSSVHLATKRNGMRFRTEGGKVFLKE